MNEKIEYLKIFFLSLDVQHFDNSFAMRIAGRITNKTMPQAKMRANRIFTAMMFLNLINLDYKYTVNN